MSRTKYGRDVNVVNADIRRRADLDVTKESPKQQQNAFPPMSF
jgi:hypothetical protein